MAIEAAFQFLKIVLICEVRNRVAAPHVRRARKESVTLEVTFAILRVQQ